MTSSLHRALKSLIRATEFIGTVGKGEEEGKQDLRRVKRRKTVAMEKWEQSDCVLVPGSFQDSICGKGKNRNLDTSVLSKVFSQLSQKKYTEKTS